MGWGMDEAFTATSFGKFFLLAKIAEGGMGEIFLAKERGIAGFEKIVAIKRILPEFSRSSRFIQMFQDEAILAGKINHPNIVYTNELGEIDGSFYISMEYIHGEPLDAFLPPSAPRIPLDHALYIAISVLSALDYAHNLRYGEDLYLIHRDIKPKNILLTYEGGVKIIDFGISKNLQRKFATQPDTVKGTPEYMSPEQIAGSSVIDHRSDLFSFGIVFWEMLTGHRLFEAPTFKETCSAVLHRSILPPSSFNPEIPQELDEIVLRALMRDREVRFPSAAAFRDALLALRRKRGIGSGAIELAAYLQEHFGERIAEADLRLERFKGMTLPFPAEKKSNASTVDFLPDGKRSANEVVRKRSPSFHRPLLFLLLLFVGGGAGLLPLLYKRDAHLDVQSVPEGALVYLDGRRIGTTPLTGIELVPNRVYELRLVKQGYREASQLLQPGPGDRLRLPFRLQAFATLEIASEPPGARILLDGKVVEDRTPALLSHLDPTIPHTVELSREGYLPSIRVFHVQPGEKRSVTLSLTPLPGGGTAAAVASRGKGEGKAHPPARPVASATPKGPPVKPQAGKGTPGEGTSSASRPHPPPLPREASRKEGETSRLTIRTEPAGATILLDGRPLPRKTPIEAFPLDRSGRRTLTLTLPGFAPFTTTLEARPGETVTLQHRFERRQYGQLIVDSQPWTTVFLDGVKLDTTPVLRDNVPAGEHTLRLYNPSAGLDEVIPISIEPGRLNKIAPRFEGFLTVHLDRPAEVYLDGKRIGSTPIDRFPVVIGAHELKLKFIDLSGEMTLPLRIRRGETTRFTEATIR
ncbi:MAG: PEGA domain-containing protein [Deltaproteobacteria bacterium]|nr:MAG: PEGA domain-containing protein [Deltaproteobacteria bacterium]